MTFKKESQCPTSYIKHWGIGVYEMYSAPLELLQRQTMMTPANPNVSYTQPLATSVKTDEQTDTILTKLK